VTSQDASSRLSTLIAVAGAATGVGLLMYVVGATTLWLALRSRGYSSDIAIAHEPRSLLIGLGLRGIVFVSVLSAVLGAIAAFILLQGRVCTVVCRVRFRWALLAAILLLFAAAWTTWRWFAVAIAVATLILAVSFRLRLAGFSQIWHGVALALAAALAALAWQYGGPVYVDSVRVRPAELLLLQGVARKSEACPGRRPRSAYTFVRGRVYWIAELNPCGFVPTEARQKIARRFSRVCPVPYFGESGRYVYVGRMRNVGEIRSGHCSWQPGPIIELPRSRVLLQFPHGQIQLNHATGAPMFAVWDIVRKL
jgi:hypothetical protein